MEKMKKKWEEMVSKKKGKEIGGYILRLLKNAGFVKTRETVSLWVSKADFLETLKSYGRL